MRALEGCHVNSKSPSRVRDGEEGVAGRNRREKHFLTRQVVIKSIIFFPKRKNETIELVAGPAEVDLRKEPLQDTLGPFEFIVVLVFFSQF